MTPLPLGGRGRALVLGTAHWGSGVDRASAHALLDRFVAHGGRMVETAPGYPANGDPDSYQAAVALLAEWLQANRNSGVSVILKIGATDNLGGRDVLLNPSFIELSAEIWEGALGGALGCLVVDRDDRSDTDAIARTVHAFRLLHEQGLGIGLSSVRRPDLYAAADPLLCQDWVILAAVGMPVGQGLGGMRAAFPDAPCMAYAGARPHLEMGSLAPARASDLPPLFLDPALQGIIVSPSSTDELDDILSIWAQLAEARIMDTEESCRALSKTADIP